MFKVVYNGYTIELFETLADSEQFIADRLSEYQHLNPKLIFKSTGNDNAALETDITYHDNCKILSVSIFQYKTLYTEMVMILERNR